MIKKVVITAAGIGTRLLTMTKEQPKEMMPLFANNNNDASFCVKPLLQIVFEQLYENNFRDFCFIIGRGKRVIEDHFTIDLDFIRQLIEKGKQDLVSPLEHFYDKLNASLIIWINQPHPRGFGDAVLMAKPYVNNETFLVHAGDTCIASPYADQPIDRLMKTHIESKSDATILLKEITNPRQYGVAEVRAIGSSITVERVVEKPDNPSTNLAIMPIYIFNNSIITMLEETLPGLGREIQLTDAIQKLIENDFKVKAVKLRNDERRLDVGNPETYWDAIKTSYQNSKKNIKLS